MAMGHELPKSNIKHQENTTKNKENNPSLIYTAYSLV
jgi:hypothetical protein